MFRTRSSRSFRYSINGLRGAGPGLFIDQIGCQGTKRGKNVPSGVLEHAGGLISGQKRSRRDAGADAGAEANVNANADDGTGADARARARARARASADADAGAGKAIWRAACSLPGWRGRPFS